MTSTCQQIAEQASELLDGRLEPGMRLAFDEHLRACDGCRAFVAQLEATRLALGRLPPPEVPAALRDALLARFDAVAASAPPSPEAAEPGADRLRPWILLAVVAVVGLLIFAGRHPSFAAADLVVSAGLATAALAIAGTAHRFGPRHAVLGAVAAGLAALAAGRGGPLDAGEGAVCFTMELGGAAAVGLVAWTVARRGSRSYARRALAGGALAGALAADAALQVTCGAHLALAHLAAFHVVGVALVAVIAARVVRSPARPAAA